MAPNTPFSEVPRNIQGWRLASKIAGVQRRKINSFTGMHSGSEMTKEQYLVMRVLYPTERPIHSFNPAMYDLERTYQSAVTLLNGLPDFQAFMQSVRTGSAITSQSNLGTFTVPRINQFLIEPALPSATGTNVLVRTMRPPISVGSSSSSTRAATAGTSKDPEFDEEVVNVGLPRPWQG